MEELMRECEGGDEEKAIEILDRMEIKFDDIYSEDYKYEYKRKPKMIELIIIIINNNLERVLKRLIEKMDEGIYNKIYDDMNIIYLLIVHLHTEKKSKLIKDIINGLINKMSSEIINHRKENKYNLLHILIIYLEDENIICELLRRDIFTKETINQANAKLVTPLMYAIDYNMNIASNLLIDRVTEENINQLNDMGMSALSLACYNNNEKIALRLIEKTNKKIVNHIDIYKSTAYTYANQYFMLNIINKIIKMNKN